MPTPILVLAYFFPPCNLTSAERVYSWANYFKEEGYYPIFITRNWDEHLTNATTDAYKSSTTEHSIQTYDGYEVHYLNYTPSFKEKLFTKLYGTSFYSIYLMVAFLSNIKQLLFLKSSPYYIFYTYIANYITTNTHIKQLIVSVSPFELLGIGYKLNKKHNLAWVADYRDDWSTSEIYHTSFPKKILNLLNRYLEKKWTRSASFFTSVSEKYIQRIESFLQIKGYEIPNGFEPKNYLFDESITLYEDFTISYVGSIYPTQPIEFFLEGIINFINHEKNPRLKVNFIGIKNEALIINRILKHIKGYESYFQFTERVPKHQAIEIQSKSHCLLACAHEQLKGIPSSKLYEYLAIKKHVILFPSDHDIMEQILLKTRQGIICNNQHDFQIHINKLYESYKNQTFPKYPDFDEIEIAKYSREVSSRKFAQILKKEFNSYHSNPSKSSRILVYIGGLTTCEKGAVGTHTRGIVKAFISSQKFTQYFLIGSGLECFDQQEELQKIDLNHLGQPEGHFLNKLNYFSKYALTIYNHIIDIAHRNPSSEIILYHRYALGISNNLIQALKSKKHTFKLILEYNDITIDQLKFAAKNNQWSAIGQLVRVNPISLKIIEQQEKNCIQYANFVVCVTDKLKTYTDQLSNQTNSIVVENATEKKLIESFKDTDKYALREKLNLDPTKFYLCHVGTLTYWDGLQELISSLPKLSCIHQIQFLIIGDGSCKKELIALVQKLNLSQHVQFFDAIPFQDALKYVYIADVIPLLKTITSYQLSPIKYYESMGLGKFLLTSDTPYINGISNLKLGAKVSLPLNCEEISNTLEDLFQRRSQIDELSNSIKQYAIQHHTWEQRVSLINQALGIHSSAI